MSVSTIMDTTSLREAVAAARVVFAEVAVESIPPGELGCALGEIAALRNQLDALDVAIVRQAKATTEWAADGSRSVNAWVQRKSSCTRALAGRKIAASKLLAHTPALAEAFRDGHTSLEHVSVVTAAIQPGPRTDRIGEADQIFTTLATHTGPGQLRRAVTMWASRVDETAAAHEYADLSERAYLHVSPLLDGMIRIDGMLDPETGQILIDALKATREQLQPVDRTADMRPVSQQNASALHHLLAAALASGNIGNGPSGLPVTLFVTTTLDTLQAQLEDAGAIPAELVGTGPLPAATARRLACDAHIIPAVLDGQSRILDVGTSTRTIPKHLRAAVTARDQHCRFGDCQHPIEEIHHLIFWSHGGPTSLDNLAGLCRAHHNAVHERGLTLTGNANKTLTVHRPSR